MFQFRRFPSITYWFSYRSHSLLYERFPHSEICGSMDICSSPQLIAACHVLLRLPVPRHSPCALSSLTFMLESSRVVRNCMFTEFLQLPIIIFHFRIIFQWYCLLSQCISSIQFSKYNWFLMNLLSIRSYINLPLHTERQNILFNE